MRYQLNFLSTAAFKRHQEHQKQFIILLSSIVWIFSFFLLFNMYRSIKFKTTVYESKVRSVQSNIVELEPELSYLKQLVNERNQLKKYLPLYLEERYRPSIWQARLYDLAELLPQDLVLSAIEFKPYNEEAVKRGGKKSKLKKEDVPEIKIDGYMVFKNKTQDIYSVDEYRERLIASATMEPVYSKIDILNNRIYKDEDNLKLIFSLGYFE